MRVLPVIVACALLAGGAYWLYDSGPSPEAPPAASASGRAAAASGGGTTMGASSLAGPSNAEVLPSEPNGSLRRDSAGPRSAYASRSEQPSDAPSSRLSVGQATQALSGAAAPAEREKPDRKVGKLTLQGSYTYIPKDNATRPARASVTIAGTLDCFTGKGAMSYADPKARVEWQSTAFSFDANAICATESENLEALVNRFDATVVGVYSPLQLGADAQMMGDGQFALRFASIDAAGVRLPHVIVCLTLQDGAYARYALPQNASNLSSVPVCTYLDNFVLKRVT